MCACAFATSPRGFFIAVGGAAAAAAASNYECHVQGLLIPPVVPSDLNSDMSVLKVGTLERVGLGVNIDFATLRNVPCAICFRLVFAKVIRGL